MSALDRVMSDPTWVAQKPPVFDYFDVVGLGYQLPVQPPTLPLTTSPFFAITQKRALDMTEVMSTHGALLATYLKTTQAPSPQAALLSAYIKEAQALPFVEAVFADDMAGLTIYTVYRGDPDEIDTDLYLAYQRMYQMFPLAMADFRMVPVERSGALPRSARRLFARA